jgi:hypothetical protein
MTQVSTKFLISSLAILTLFSFAPLVSASSQNFVFRSAPGNLTNCPTSKCSTNWSGYAVSGAAGSVSDVVGSWTVPKATCGSSTSYSSFWVGIDGFTSKTVEQTGTDSDCKGGAHYYAWYEFYPAASVVISGFTVKPGDVVTAEVSYTGGLFTTTIKDGAQTFSKTGTVSGAARSSAEWIIERPALCVLILCKLTHLTNFGTASLGSDFTGISGTNYATIGGTSGPISSFAYSQITMVNSGGKVLAEPSALTTDGTSFTEVWHASS